MTSKPIDRLRAEVRKRRGAVTAKENRINRSTGVDIRNTAQDPRRPVKVVERYTTNQLNKYLGELNAFMSRGTGFVGGANNAAIPKAAWLAYKRLEKQYNEIGADHFQSVGGILIKITKEETGLTVAERNKLMVPDSKRAQGEIVHRPYSPLDRKPSRVKDANSLAKLTADIQKKISADYLPAQIAAGRSQLNQMLKTIGEGDSMMSKAAGLTDHQFDVLWNYTGFPTAVATISESEKKRNRAVAEYKNPQGVVEGTSSDVRKFLDWAKSLPEENTKRSKKITGKARTNSKKQTFNRK